VSDTPQGDGWWQASDGKFYPPEQHPHRQPAPAPVYQPPTYQPPAFQQPQPAATESNGLAVAALVLGIIGVLSGLIPLFFLGAWACGALALIFGLTGRRRPAKKGMATAGSILGVAALVLGTIGVVIVVNAVDDVDDALTDFDESMGEEALGDAEITDCSPVDGYFNAEVEVTNSTEETRDYFVEVSFLSPDGSRELSSASATVNGLGPGETRSGAAEGFEQADDRFTCEVTSVDRFES
jgi:hypothetical protein